LVGAIAVSSADWAVEAQPVAQQLPPPPQAPLLQHSPPQLSHAQAPPVSQAQPASTQTQSTQAHEAPQQQLASIAVKVEAANGEISETRNRMSHDISKVSNQIL
jgi:hypothetical protein